MNSRAPLSKKAFLLLMLKFETDQSRDYRILQGGLQCFKAPFTRKLLRKHCSSKLIYQFCAPRTEHFGNASYLKFI